MKGEEFLQEHRRRMSGAVEPLGMKTRDELEEKHASYSHSRTSSTTVQGVGLMKREEEDDEMAEVDEIENDVD